MQTKIVETDTLLALADQGLGVREIARQTGISPAAVSKRLQRLRQSEPPESFSRLTPKQQRFVEELAAGKTQTDAAMIAFDCTSRTSAKALGCTLMKEEEINISLADLMASEGIPRRKRVQRLAQFIEGKDTAAAVRSLELSFKLDGSMTERIEVGVDSNLIRQLISSLPDKAEAIEAEFTPIA